MSVEQEIRNEIYQALELMNADPHLLAVVGSWGGTLSDDEVLRLLKQWNEEENPAQVPTASLSVSEKEIDAEEGEALLGDLAQQLKKDNPPVAKEAPQPIFEIPDTTKTRAFLARSPKFPAAFKKLLDLSNKCFGRNPHDKDHLEHICFWLGHTCRQDFLEVVFLAINGYGAGAVKILRSLYERAVTIEYLIQNPSKVDRFLQFAAIQEKRLTEATLKHVSQEQIDAQMGPENTVEEIRKRYEQYKGNFKATECEVCGVKTPPSWDVDFVTMVGRVGEPYTKVLLLAYNNPNLAIHATLASTTHRDEEREEKDAESAVIVATEMILAVIRAQNALFSLKLDADIDACTQDLRDAQAHALSIA